MALHEPIVIAMECVIPRHQRVQMITAQRRDPDAIGNGPGIVARTTILSDSAGLKGVVAPRATLPRVIRATAKTYVLLHDQGGGLAEFGYPKADPTLGTKGDFVLAADDPPTEAGDPLEHVPKPILLLEGPNLVIKVTDVPDIGDLIPRLGGLGSHWRIGQSGSNRVLSEGLAAEKFRCKCADVERISGFPFFLDPVGRTGMTKAPKPNRHK